MKIDNGVYITIPITWGEATVIKEGTPVDNTCQASNDGDAIGIVTQQIVKGVNISSAYVLVGGDINLAEAEAAYGSSYATACKDALNGIRLHLSDDSVYETPVPAELPTVTAADSGKVLSVNNAGSWVAAEASGGASGLLVNITGTPGSRTLDKSYNEIKAVIDNGIMPVFTTHMESEGNPTFELYYYTLLIMVSGEMDGTMRYQAIIRMDSTDGGDPTYIEMIATDGDAPFEEDVNS